MGITVWAYKGEKGVADGLSTDGLTSGVPYATGVEAVLLLGGTVRGVTYKSNWGVLLVIRMIDWSSTDASRGSRKRCQILNDKFPYQSHKGYRPSRHVFLIFFLLFFNHSQGDSFL